MNSEFSRTIQLLGEETFQILRRSSVMVLGVGAWAPTVSRPWQGAEWGN